MLINKKVIDFVGSDILFSEFVCLVESRIHEHAWRESKIKWHF